MNESIVNFRVDTELKKAFEIAAKSEDMTSSQLLRRFMREKVENYMRSNAQGSLIEPVKKQNNTKAKANRSVIPDAWRAK